jgi:hypothetical protein
LGAARRGDRSAQKHQRTLPLWGFNSLPFSAASRKVYGLVEELPSANTQGATLEEARANLQEAVTLVLEASRTLAQETISGQDVMRGTLKVGR